MQQQEESEFTQLPLIDKIDKIIEYERDYLKEHHTLKDKLFLFDVSDTLYMIPIDNEKFLNNEDYKKLFTKIIISLVSDIENKYNTTISNVLYIYTGIFDVTIEDIVNLDTSWKEDLERRAAMIVLLENEFNTDIRVYDRITVVDVTDRYTVVSGKPIKKLNLSKLDPDHYVSGFLTNILT